MKDRVNYIDEARGVAIILMIIGHCLQKSCILRQYIYIVHMPLFYIISGIFYKEKNTKDLIKKSYRSLFIPYTITSTAIILGKMAISFLKKENFLLEGKKWIIATLYGTGEMVNFFGLNIEIIGAIWFFLSLFWVKLIFNSIRKIKNIKIEYIVIMAIALFGFVLPKFIWLPFSIETGFVAIIYYCAGYIISKYQILEKKIGLIRIIPITFFWILGSYFCITNVATNFYNLYFFNIVIGIMGSFLILYFFRTLRFNELLKKNIKWLGENSMYILCFHTIEGRGVIPWRKLIHIENVFVTIVMRIVIAILGTVIFTKIKKEKIKAKQKKIIKGSIFIRKER